VEWSGACRSEVLGVGVVGCRVGVVLVKPVKDSILAASNIV
jgi:hypothetical protein